MNRNMDDEKTKVWKKECAVESCKNKNTMMGNNSLSFHHFPLKKMEMCRHWVNEARIRFIPMESHYICGTHFRDKDYKSSKRKYLKETAVPSIFA